VNVPRENPGRLALFLPSLAAGGAERVFVELANEFSRQGHAVDLALANASGPFLGEVAPSVRIIDFGAAGVLRAVPRLARYLRRERPAALLSALEHANVAALLGGWLSLTGTRCVLSVRGVPTMLGHEAGDAQAKRLLAVSRIAYVFAAAIIANSHGVAADMSTHLGIARRKINVIYNPLNLQYIEHRSAEPVTHPFCSSGSPPLLLSVGRLSPLKDFSTLIRGFARLRAKRDCRLVILGDGEQRSELEHLASTLGVARDVSMPGFDANPFAWMRRAALFASTSLSEGCPNALMQALACGTRVVSTDAVGGSAEILEHGKWGRVVPVRDDSALAGAFAATLDDPSPPDVRTRALAFALPDVAREYLSLMLPRDDARLVA
jgi:glycosyltransferase involved in cell wall biosynthesis